MKKTKLRVKFCPKCGGKEVAMVIGGQLGLWECKKCKFRGSIFPEKEIILEEKKKKEKKTGGRKKTKEREKK